jgi:hypothetical protein
MSRDFCLLAQFFCSFAHIWGLIVLASLLPARSFILVCLNGIAINRVRRSLCGAVRRTQSRNLTKIKSGNQTLRRVDGHIKKC